MKVGVSLKRVAIINDNFEEIRDEVRRQAQLFDLVITSGGVGPTHDDVVRPNSNIYYFREFKCSRTYVLHARRTSKLQCWLNFK